MRTIINIIKEHIVWRHQIFKLAKSDLIKTYSGAALGWAWAIVKPTIMITVFWFALSIGLRMGDDIGEYPAILWLVVGLVPWFYMSDMITGGASSVKKYSYLVTKMKFPVSTIPTFVSLSHLFIHFFLMIIVIGIFILYGFMPDIYMLQLPIYILLMLIFFILWSLFASMLAAISKDFHNLVKAFVTAIFWMSAIIWDINKMGDHPRLQAILQFNPVTFIANGYRNVFIYKTWIWDEPRQLLYFGIVTVLMGILAVWSYNKLHKEIPDVL